MGDLARLAAVKRAKKGGWLMRFRRLFFSVMNHAYTQSFEYAGENSTQSFECLVVKRSSYRL